MNLFKDQSYGEIIINTGIDLSGATNPKILYKTPNNVFGEWVGIIEGNNIKVTLSDSVKATWKGKTKFQSYVEFSGLKTFGEVIINDVKESLL